MSKEQQLHNDMLAEKFNPNGEFPKVIFLDSKGEIIGNMEHPLKTAKEYMNSIRTFVK